MKRASMYSAAFLTVMASHFAASSIFAQDPPPQDTQPQPSQSPPKPAGRDYEPLGDDPDADPQSLMTMNPGTPPLTGALVPGAGTRSKMFRRLNSFTWRRWQLSFIDQFSDLPQVAHAAVRTAVEWSGRQPEGAARIAKQAVFTEIVFYSLTARRC